MAGGVSPGQLWRSTGNGFVFEVVEHSVALGWVVRFEDGVTTMVDDTFFDHESCELLEASSFE